MPVMAEPMAAVMTAAVGDPDARMTPAVRRLLREHGLEAAQIVGTGGGGRLTRDDVLDFVEAQRTGKPVGAPGSRRDRPRHRRPPPARPPPPPAPPAPRPRSPAPTRPIAFPAGADEVLLPMTQMRKGIAAQMTRALAVPHAYVHMEVNVAGLVRLRESNKREYQAREGISLSYVPVRDQGLRRGAPPQPDLQRALDRRRASWPSAGSTWASPSRSTTGSSCRSSATSTSTRSTASTTRSPTSRTGAGQQAPHRRLRRRHVHHRQHRLARLEPRDADHQRAGGRHHHDGGDHQARRRHREPDGDSIAIRPVMNLVMGIDHRANDGAGAAAFLRDVKAWLEAVGPYDRDLLARLFDPRRRRATDRRRFRASRIPYFR